MKTKNQGIKPAKHILLRTVISILLVLLFFGGLSFSDLCGPYQAQENSIYQQEAKELGGQINSSQVCVDCLLMDANILASEGGQTIYSGDSVSYTLYLTKIQNIEKINVTVTVFNTDGSILGSRTYPNVCLFDNKTTSIVPYQLNNLTHDIFQLPLTGSYHLMVSTIPSVTILRYYPKTASFTFHTGNESFYFEAMPKWQKEFIERQTQLLTDISNATLATENLINEEKISNIAVTHLAIITAILAILSIILAKKPDYERKKAICQNAYRELDLIFWTILGLEKVGKENAKKLVTPGQIISLKSVAKYKSSFGNESLNAKLTDLLVDLQLYNNVLKKYLSWSLVIRREMEPDFQKDEQQAKYYTAVFMNRKADIAKLSMKIRNEKWLNDLSWFLFVGSLLVLTMTLAVLYW